MAEIGALSLRLQETGGAAVANRLKQIDTQAKATGQSVETVAAVLRQLGIGAKVAGGQIVVAAAQMDQAASIAGKFGQAQAVVTVATQQTTQATAAQATTTTQASTATKTAAAAAGSYSGQLAKTTQATTAQTQATQRQTQATTRQAAATQALGGTFTKANGQLTAFSKAGVRNINGIAFAFAAMASSGQLSLRSIAGQLSAMLALTGKIKGAIAAISASVALAIVDMLQGKRRRAIDQAALEAQTAIRNTLVAQKAASDLSEAQQEAAYSQGLASLNKFYDGREKIIRDRARDEAQAKRAEADAAEREARGLSGLSTVFGIDLIPDMAKEFVSGETIAKMNELISKAKTLRAEASAAESQGAAEAIRNAQARIAAERQLRDAVLSFEVARREAQADTHALRLEEINREAEDYRKLLQQQGVAQNEANARVTAFVDTMRAQAGLAQAHLDISNIQTQLDTQRLAIQQQLEQGKITEADAARQIADIETSMLPTLREMVQRAQEFAAALGDEGAVSALKQLQQQMDGLGRNLQLDRLQGDMMGRFSSLGATVGMTLGAALADGIQSALTAGSGKNLFEAFGNTLLSGLGSIFVQMGSELITYGLIMSGLLPFLANPFTSGPAAIAAGTALVATGAAMAAIAANNSGRRTGGGGRGAAASSSGSDTQRIQVASGVTRRAGSAQSVAGMQAAAAGAPVTINMTLMNPNDPATQRLVTQTMRAGERRGL